MGLGPVSLGGKLGFGAGGYPGEGEIRYYEPLTSGDNGVHAAYELGLGVGDKVVAGGAGVAAELEQGYQWPSVNLAGVPTFVK